MKKRGTWRKKIVLYLLIFSLCVASPIGKLTAAAVSGSGGRMPLISGSFLQGWLCRDWSQSRWDGELAAMKELGMDTLVIQSSYDLATTAASSSAYGQDWSKYTATSRYSLYPTAIPELAGASNSADQLERALIAAKKNDMKIFIGLLSDDRWWRFGWGNPTAPSGKTDLAADSYFADWCRYNGDLAGEMIAEIWGRYGENYGEQIGGWYYYNEIWNFDAACAGTDGGVYAKILASNFNAYLNAIAENCPGKPLMLSPYFNRTLSTGAQYGAFWKSIFAQTNFKSGDIFAPQDCIGEHPDLIGTAPEWIGSLADAVKTKEGLRFWVNNETFTASYTSASVDRVISQIEATKPYAQTHLLFSWNHYYNPLYNSGYQSYNDQLAAYIEQMKEAENPDGCVEIVKLDTGENQKGFRAVYTVEGKISGKEVVESGLIYALPGVAPEEVRIGSESASVAAYANTQECGRCAGVQLPSDTASSYCMTLSFAGAGNPGEYDVRAYARLSDGSYVYSDIVRYTLTRGQG